MSKGNMLLGYARGKVGSMVFSRSKGEQITRAYNGSPRNDRTEPQMNQRTMFLSANKFFTHGQQAFFKFAYEDKRQNESDFNAFMRNNVKNGLMMSKAAFEENTYPSVGEWLVTKGSLPGINLIYYSGEDPQLPKFIVGPASQGDQGSVAHLSKDLKRYYGVQEGDIITILCIVAEGSDSNNTPSVNPGMRQRIRWIINQFTIDTNSILRISDIMQDGVGFFIHEASDQWGLIVPDSVSNIAGACISVSRKTRRGLKVSNTKIVTNTQGRNVLTAGNSETYKKAVRASWQTSTRAILEGTEGSTPYDRVGFIGFRGIGGYYEEAIELPETSIGQELATAFSNRTNEPTIYVNCKNPENLSDDLLTCDNPSIPKLFFGSKSSCINFFTGLTGLFWQERLTVRYNGTAIFYMPANPFPGPMRYTKVEKPANFVSEHQKIPGTDYFNEDYGISLIYPRNIPDDYVMSRKWGVTVNDVVVTFTHRIEKSPYYPEVAILVFEDIEVIENQDVIKILLDDIVIAESKYIVVFPPTT